MLARRIIEPIVLGLIANTVVNFVFNPSSFKTSASEYAVAVLLSIPITELNRYIDLWLDKKVAWIKSPLKRLFVHFAVILAGVVVFLNVLGNGYMWLTNKGSFTGSELFTINIICLFLAIALTLMKWSIHFYRHWVVAEEKVRETTQAVDKLKKGISQSEQSIEMQKGNGKMMVQINSIQIAKIEFGTVRLFLQNGDSGIFPGTMEQINQFLPDHLFFQASRGVIIHRDSVVKVSSATFGKVFLIVKKPAGEELKVTVSRPKAAAFRKWFNSISR